MKLSVTFYIEMNGEVTITSLFAPLLPLAHALNPDDQRINKFLLTQTEVKNVTLLNNKDKTG